MLAVSAIAVLSGMALPVFPAAKALRANSRVPRLNA
jgi:hypothetical protein